MGSVGVSLQASNIDDVLGHHTSFLDTCLKDCMLTNPELLKVFSKLMSVCVMFTNCMQVWPRPAHPSRGPRPFPSRTRVSRTRCPFVRARLFGCGVGWHLSQVGGTENECWGWTGRHGGLPGSRAQGRLHWGGLWEGVEAGDSGQEDGDQFSLGAAWGCKPENERFRRNWSPRPWQAASRGCAHCPGACLCPGRTGWGGGVCRQHTGCNRSGFPWPPRGSRRA